MCGCISNTTDFIGGKNSKANMAIAIPNINKEELSLPNINKEGLSQTKH